MLRLREHKRLPVVEMRDMTDDDPLVLTPQLTSEHTVYRGESVKAKVPEAYMTPRANSGYRVQQCGEFLFHLPSKMKRLTQKKCIFYDFTKVGERNLDTVSVNISE
jgi:hypothetical protein